MIEPTEAGVVLRAWWDRIDAREWDEMAELLDPQLRVHYVHTGEDLTADGFVRLNREYPGRWHAVVKDLVAADGRAVSHAEVTDGTEDLSGGTYQVASFATVPAGRITDLVELWTDDVASPPKGRRPAQRG